MTKTSKSFEIKNHQWVNYGNPRNGLIQVTACEYCGTMMAGAPENKSCSPTSKKNPMLARGWTIKSSHAILGSANGQEVA